MNYIEKFRRYYHKVRKVVPALRGTSISSLRIEYQNKNLYTEMKTPARDQTVRLVALMRRFFDS